GEALGKIRELTEANALIAAAGDPIEALAGGEDGPPTSALEPDSDQTKTLLPSGVTVAGSEVKRAAITDLVDQYRQLWVDDGTPAEIPMKYWLTVPTKQGAALPKKAKPYPASPAEREIIDQTLDKLHEGEKL
ncbi:hypothetical protein KEM52_003767, partial [Ascosphaera acerosa]